MEGFWENDPSTNSPRNAENFNLLSAGWTKLKTGDTLTFSSADAPTYVVSTNRDLRNYLSVGMKLRLTHGGVTKYFFITAIDASTITLYGGTDYTLSASTISDVYFSGHKNPYGFPTDIEKWQISASVYNQTNPFTVSARTAKTMLSIELPIGLWNIENIGWVNWRTNSPGVVFDGNYGLALQQDSQASSASGGFNQITYVADTANNSGGDFRSNVSTSLLGYKVTNKQTIYGNAYQYLPNAQYRVFGRISLKATIAYL